MLSDLWKSVSATLVVPAGNLGTNGDDGVCTEFRVVYLEHTRLGSCFEYANDVILILVTKGNHLRSVLLGQRAQFRISYEHLTSAMGMEFDMDSNGRS